MIQAILRPIDAEKLQMKIEIQMTLGEWQEIKKQLTDKHPSWILGQAISNAIYHAEQTFDAEVDLTKSK